MVSVQLVVLYVFLHPLSYIRADYPLITLKLGVIRGTYMTTLTGRKFSAFRGIPYAKPPVGQLRFKPPQKLNDSLSPQPFDGTKDGSMCGQVNLYTRTLIGDEDCLILNVYTPQILNHAYNPTKLPVMVYIHGGGLTFGSSASSIYGPRRLLDHDIILVTFNYRLNIFGFLSTSDEASPGNYGLLDQIEVLKWVRENIRFFGGDKDKVTLFGEGAGAACVDYHISSKLSTGLFSAAIQLSGNFFAPWAYNVHDLKSIINHLALKFDCNRTNSFTIIQCLRDVPFQELLKILPEFFGSGIRFHPTADDLFISDTPINLYGENQIVNRVPVMAGIAKNEGIFLYEEIQGFLKTNIDDRIKRVISNCLHTNVTDTEKLQIATKMIRDLYFKSTHAESRHQLIRFLSDCYIVAPFNLWLNFYLNLDLKPFIYSFDYVTNHSVVESFFNVKAEGATHWDGLFFLFDNTELFGNKSLQLNDANENKFLELWLNFVKYRKPTLRGEKKLVHWPPATKKNLQIYHLDNPMRTEKFQIDQELIDFWFKKIPDALKTSK